MEEEQLNNTQPPPPMAEQQQQQQQDSLDTDKETVTQLKNLNIRLVQKTVQKRAEISALMEIKKSMESELNELRSELTQFKEDAEVAKEGLRREKEEAEKKLEEIEKEMREVVKERDEMEKAKIDGDFEIGTMKKMEKELRGEIKKEKDMVKEVVLQRNQLKNELEVFDEEVNKLGKKLRESELKAINADEELEELKSMYQDSVHSLKEKEAEVGLLRNELSVMGKKCEGLNGEKKAVSKSNEELLREVNKKNGKIVELEKDLSELNRVHLRVSGELEKLRGHYFEKDRSSAEALEKLSVLNDEMSCLIEEKNEKEKEIKRLMADQSIMLASFDEIKDELKSVGQDHEDALVQNDRLEEVKLRQQEEISMLRKRLTEVGGKASSLEKSNKGYVEQMKKLVSEIDDHKKALEKVTTERDEVKKSLDEEKKHWEILQGKVSKISKEMEEATKASKDFKEIQNKYNKLVQEKELVEKDLVAAKGKIDELEMSSKAKTEMFEMALSMLRNSILQPLMENEKSSGDEGIMKANEHGEMGPILAELESMRVVFRKKEEKVGEMQQEMANLQCSLMDVKKKKSFWTIVSSATTILAAVVSYAYASRVR
ncbi:hypothetical protein BVRB_4g083220 [Beta vulgaris subsp. vulgaris]|nr:hypothetical protein BVRB_4g083220 [Beta vulgaris subsp. vulgaris]